jgi:hypothetical protein
MKESKVTTADKLLETRDCKILFVDIDSVCRDTIRDRLLKYEILAGLHDYSMSFNKLILLGYEFYKELYTKRLKSLEEEIADLITDYELYILRYTGRSPRSFRSGDFIDCYFDVCEKDSFSNGSRLIHGKEDDTSRSFLTREHNIIIDPESVVITKDNDYSKFAKELGIKVVNIHEVI